MADNVLTLTRLRYILSRVRDLAELARLGDKVDATFKAWWKAEEAFKAAQTALRKAVAEFEKKYSEGD